MLDRFCCIKHDPQNVFLNELQHDAAPEAAALTVCRSVNYCTQVTSRAGLLQTLEPDCLSSSSWLPILSSPGSPGQVTEPFSALVSSSAKWYLPHWAGGLSERVLCA